MRDDDWNGRGDVRRASGIWYTIFQLLASIFGKVAGYVIGQYFDAIVVGV